MCKRNIITIVVLIFTVMLVSCSKNETEKSDTPGIYPLTGEETNEAADRRIISVMVNNHAAARPQSGLTEADIVFEILAEGDITRFLALYQSEQPEVVGPVRSAREYYFDLAERYDAIYVYHGAATFINDMIKSRDIEAINGASYDDDGHLFKRESFRKAPHNSYLQFAAIDEVLDEKGYDTNHTYDTLPFKDDDEAIEGDTAEHVVVTYPGRNVGNNVEFVYNDKSEKYERYEAQQQSVDLTTDKPVEVDNVLIIEAHHEVIDDEGRRSINLDDGGDAYLIQQGKAQSLVWESQNGRFVPVQNGEVVGFVKGKTWVNVVPANPGIGQSVTIE